MSRSYSTHIAAVGLLMCALSTWASAQSSVNYTFDDGQVHGDASSMKVSPKVVAGALRITGSASDKQSIPSSLPSPYNRLNRSTVTFTSNYSSMPVITSANMRQTYRARMRASAPCPYGCTMMELFQGAPGGEGHYGQSNGTGPSARFTTVKGQAYFETRYQNETKVDRFPLGVSTRDYHTYQLNAVWSHDRSVGRFDIFVDGAKKRSITGRDVNLGPETNRLPLVKVGLYGIDGVGTVDVDHITVGSGGAGDEPPPSDGPPAESPPVVQPLPPPRNFRVVMK